MSDGWISPSVIGYILGREGYSWWECSLYAAIGKLPDGFFEERETRLLDAAPPKEEA